MPLWHISAWPVRISPRTAAVRGRCIGHHCGVQLPAFLCQRGIRGVAEGFLVRRRQADQRLYPDLDRPDRAPRAGRRRPDWLERISKTVAPFVQERGFRWEVHIDDTPIFDFWTIQGLKPPEGGSEAEKRWAAENKASPYS